MKRSVEFDMKQAIDSMLDAGDNELYDRLLGAVERELITRVLRHTHGHLGHACERLGIDRKTLRNKLRDLRIVPEKLATDDTQLSDG